MFQIPAELMDYLQNIQLKQWSNPVEVTTPTTANAVFVVPHNLSTIPTQFLVVYKTQACDVYDAYTRAHPNYQWTRTNAFLKCDQPNVTLKISFR